MAKREINEESRQGQGQPRDDGWVDVIVAAQAHNAVSREVLACRKERGMEERRRIGLVKYSSQCQAAMRARVVDCVCRACVQVCVSRAGAWAGASVAAFSYQPT